MRRYILILFCCLALVSCEDFLEEQPQSVLTPENAFETPEDWQKMLNAAYGMLQKVYVGKNTMTLAHFGTDEVEPYDLSWGAYVELKMYTLSASHPFLADHYRVTYEGVKRANAVIDIPSGVISDSEKGLMIAQAKFLRAIYYFDLVRMYGGIPLWTKTSIDRDEIMKPRATVDEVYELIVQDLKEAEAELPPTWSAQEDKGRATKYAAQAILARVYLQWGEPALALEYLNMLDGQFHLYDDLEDIFSPGNKNEEYENIFEIQFRHSGSWGLEGSIQHSYWGPRDVGGPVNFGGWGGFGPTQYMYDSYDDDDKRKEAFFFTEFEGVVQSPPTNRKFFDPVYGNVIEDDNLNFVLIRYADILLMKAEALNRLNNDGPEKYNALNQVRERAGLNPISSSSNLSQEDFAEVVLEERLHELAFEHMRRWDLIRFGKLKEYLRDHVGINISDYHTLYPIPQNSMDANTAIEENNPGY